MLLIESFNKRYHDERILSIPGLELNPGIHLVQGGNGSGKTTLFKCLAGLLPFEGDVSINQVSLKKNPVGYRYLVNFAEAEPLFPHYLTARDLMLFVGRTKKATESSIQYYKDAFAIGPFFEKPCGSYSSGMLKKLSLALSFLGDPAVIVLDEPLITLDTDARKNLFQIIREKAGTLFFLSSHQALDADAPPVTSIFKIKNKQLVPDSID